MPSAHSSPIPKKEFIEVITDSDLTLTPTSHKFSSILTEASLLDTETLIPPIPHADLVKYCNQMFPTLNSYKSFMNCQLSIWEQDLQVKYFDLLYRHQWAMTNSIKILHDRAQKLLEEANRLQERKHSFWREIDHHLHTIMQPKLCQCLYNPYKVYPWPTPPTIQRTQPISSSSWPVLFNPNPKKWIQLRCFQCDSPTHIKWNCPKYRCRYCGDMAPGHSQQNCPKNGFETYDDGLWGHYDIRGEEDGNVNGECWTRLVRGIH